MTLDTLILIAPMLNEIPSMDVMGVAMKGDYAERVVDVLQRAREHLLVGYTEDMEEIADIDSLLAQLNLIETGSRKEAYDSMGTRIQEIEN